MFKLVPTIVPIPTLNEVQSLLDSQLANLQELHNNHQAELIQIQREIDSLTFSNVQMENELQNTKKRYNYFQEFKTFVENLVEFLDDKVKLHYTCTACPLICKMHEIAEFQLCNFAGRWIWYIIFKYSKYLTLVFVCYFSFQY